MPPKTAMYKHTFMVGYWDAGATVDLPKTGGGTTTVTTSDATGVNALRNPGYVGFNTGVKNPFYYYSTPAVQEDTQFVSDKLDAEKIHHVVGPWGRYGLPGQSIQEQFYAADPSVWTEENADSLAVWVIANYQDHTHLVGYNFEDDVSLNASMDHQDAVVLMAQAFQNNDQYERPAFFVHLFPNEHNYWADYDCKVGVSYMYACGYRADNPTLETEEGNFMSARIPSAVTASVNSSHPDWVDWFRYWMSFLPEGAQFWPILQTHDTTGTGASGIRTPTDREMRKMFWIAIGEGAKGIFWFPGDNSADIVTKGLWDTTRHSSLVVASELSQRLTPAIRKILLKCERVADQFTVNGGGVVYAAGRSYDKVYQSTLQHEDGTYYLVLCNHSTTASFVVPISFPSEGYLTNLETGDQYPVATLITLPALDGTIYRFDEWNQDFPHYEPDHGTNSVETWYDNHWANPDSDKYIPVGSLTPTSYETVVAAGNLQDALDDHIAAGNYPPTTFKLADGNHDYVVTTGLANAYMVADDELNRPVWYGHLAFGDAEAEWYNTFGALKGFATKVGIDGDATALAAWNNPKENLMYRNIDFRPAPGTLVEYKFFNRGGVWNTDHHIRNAALFFRNTRYILIESCTSQGFEMGTPDTDPRVTGVDTTYNNTGSLPAWTGAHFSGNAGVDCVVIRDCDLVGSANASRGFPAPTYFDGVRGCVFEDIRLSGKWSFGYGFLLTNGDFTADVEKRGNITREYQRDAKCNVFHNWFCDQTVYGQTNGFGITGGNNLVKGCQVDTPGGSLAFFVEFSAKAPLAVLQAQRFQYESYNNIVDDCDIIRGGCTLFVQHDPNLGILADSSPTNEYRSKVGITTVKNSHVKGTIITGWIGDKSGSTAATITPHTETNNTTG